MENGAGQGRDRWEPPWRQQIEGSGGAYDEPVLPAPPVRPGPGHGPWGDPRGWDAAAYPLPSRRPDPPPVMRTASALMLVGAGLTILSAFVFFASTDQYAEALVEATGASPARVQQAVSQEEGQEVFRTLFGVALWVWMAVKNSQGRKWARVVATVFGVINAGSLLLGGALVGGLDSGDLVEYLLPQLVIGVTSVVLGIVILVQLYRPAASQYYEEAARFEAALTLRGYR